MSQHFKHLTKEDKILIEKYLDGGISKKKIAEKLNIHISTIYREIHRGTTNNKYSATNSCKKYCKNSNKKGATPILNKNIELSVLISNYILFYNMSVLEIVKQLKEQHSIAISVNTIYSAIDKGLIPNVARNDLKSKTTKVFSDGLIHLPKHITNQLKISDGSILNIRIKNRTILITKSENV